MITCPTDLLIQADNISRLRLRRGEMGARQCSWIMAQKVSIMHTFLGDLGEI